MKRKTLRNHRDFLMSDKDLKVVCHYFMVKARPAIIPGDPRYGLVASKRSFKLAVQRNRVKRLLRDWIAFNEHLMRDDLDYVFIAYNSVLDCKRHTGRKKTKTALVKIAKLYDKKN